MQFFSEKMVLFLFNCRDAMHCVSTEIISMIRCAIQEICVPLQVEKKENGLYCNFRKNG